MCICSPHVRTRSCIPRRSIHIRTLNVYPLDTHLEPNLYPALVDTSSYAECVSSRHAFAPEAVSRAGRYKFARRMCSSPAPGAAGRRRPPNVKKPGLPPRPAPPRTRSPLRRSRQRVEFLRLHGYRPRPQPPRPPEGGIRPRTVAPASSTSADLAARLARGVDRRLNVRTL